MNEKRTIQAMLDRSLETTMSQDHLRRPRSQAEPQKSPQENFPEVNFMPQDHLRE
jgi:hypothetical protein